MKAQILILMVVLFLSSFGMANATTFSAKKTKSVENQLLLNLNSDIEGVRVNSINSLGNLFSESSVIPLLEKLKTDASESVRISAALSLYKIGDERGLFAIKQAITFDESKRVRNICDKIYNQSLQAK